MRSAALLSLLPLALAAPVQDAGAPVLVPRGATAGNKYIVRLKKPEVGISSVGASFADLITSAVDSIVANAEEEFHNFGAFSATLDAADLAKLRSNPNVAYIEKEVTMSVQATVTQSGAPWGLGRIANKSKGSTTYTYDSTAGAGTCVYIIDSGLETSHPEFEGRATFLQNFSGDGSTRDGNGHGTHVAGTIGSKTYGVAKKTKLFSVKVFNTSGQGSNANVIAGMDFVVQDAAKRASQCPNGIVVNMSLGGGASQSTDDAAQALVDAGLFVAVAAGNGDQNGNPQNASGFSPARVANVCTIGATDKNDKVGSFSNYGSVVDLHAPGVAVLSTWIGSSTNTISGTSMATPHVAGLAAYFLGLGATTPANACSYMASKAVSGAITSLRSGTKNLLVQNK